LSKAAKSSSINAESPPARIGAASREAGRDFIVASLPAAALGAWSIGRQLLIDQAAAATDAAGATAVTIWPLRLLDALGLPSTGTAAGWLTGLGLLAPPLLVALAVSRGWAEIFARARGRPLDPSWAVAAWLFALLLPPGVPLPIAALGMSFGAVFGCHVFGGTGRYLVSPPLLGAVFIAIAYPDTLGGDSGPIAGTVTQTWQTIASTGIDGAGLAWTDALLGRQLGGFGTASAAACLLGAAFLLLRRRAAWQSPAGALLGLLTASLLPGALPALWQPVLGSFAFAAAFLLTDATTAARHSAARWAQALLFGSLTVVIRTLNPEHPEGTLFALLLATLCTPLLDHVTGRCRVVLRRRRYAR